MKGTGSSPDAALYLPSLAGGGSERVTLTLANGLAERGVSVEILLGRSGGDLQPEVPEGIPVVDLGTRDRLSAVRAVSSYLHRRQPRIIYTAMYRAAPTIVFGALLSRTDTITAVEIENPLGRINRSGGVVRSTLHRIGLTWVLRRADLVLPVSEGVQRDLVNYLPIRVGDMPIIYNPVDVERIVGRSRESLDDPLASVFDSTDGRPVVMGMGRLCPQKDFVTLIRAFHELRRSVDAHLVILGEGEERANLESLITRLNLEEDVHLPGFVQNPYRYLARSGVFGLSSLWEGFGNVLVEALALGVPVVSTDCPGGPSEILGDGRWGRLVPVGDVVPLAEALRKTLAADHEPEPLKDRAEDFSVDAIVPAYLDVFFGGDQ